MKASRTAGFALANEANSFRSFFGSRADQLVRFDLAGRGLTLGAPAAKAVTPTASGDTVTYPDVFGDADLVYQVGPDQLKESIVLASTNYRTYAAATGSTDKYAWKLNVPVDGKHTVYVRYPAVTGASTAAPYAVSTGGAPVSKAVTRRRALVPG